jgi:hypothetical protein
VEVPDIPQEEKIFSHLILFTNQTRSYIPSNSKAAGIHSLFMVETMKIFILCDGNRNIKYVLFRCGKKVKIKLPLCLIN